LTKVVDRRAWEDLGLRHLDEGILPSEVTIDDAAEALHVTKGSFYTHFANAAEYHAAVITRYAADREQSRAGRKAGLVEDPRARLWMLWADASVVTTRDHSVWRWAASASAPRPAPGSVEAAAALEQADAAILADLTAALSDWNMPPGEAAVLARVLAPVFGCRQATPPVAPGDTASFGALLDLLSRAVRNDLTVTEVEVGDVGTGTGAVVMCLVAPGTSASPSARKDLAAAAREFAARHLPGLAAAEDGYQQAAPAAT